MKNEMDDYEVLAVPPFKKMEATKFLGHLLSIKCEHVCFELRAFSKNTAKSYDDRQNLVGFFDDQEKLVSAAKSLYGSRQICVSLNPRKVELLHKYPRNEMVASAEGAKEKDVARLAWVFIDVDCEKDVSGVSASDEELIEARDVADRIAKFFRDFDEIGFMLGSSGNGFHILVPINEVANEDSSQKIKSFLSWLNLTFGTKTVSVDQSTHNNGRLIKLYGTTSLKGQNTRVRPWRTAEIIEIHGKLDPIPFFEIFAEEIEIGSQVNGSGAVPKNTESESLRQNLVIEAFRKRELYVRPKGRGIHLVRCPWSSEHTSGAGGDSSTVLITGENGSVGFKCHHNHCSERSIRDVEVLFDEHFGRLSRSESLLIEGATPIEKYNKPEPKPMDQAAFSGLAGSVVNLFAPETEADAQAILLQFLVAFGNLIGSAPHIKMESAKHHTNIFTIIVGETAKARKGTSWNHVKRLLSEVDKNWVDQKITSGLASGEGLINFIRDKRTSFQDEKEVVLDHGVEDKRCLALAGEFVSVLKLSRREGNILSPVLRNAWDSNTLQSTTKISPVIASDPHVSLIGHITIDELKKSLLQVELLNGLGNRFLFVYSKRSKKLPFGGYVDEAALEVLISECRDAVEFANSQQEVLFSESARTLWTGIYPLLSESKPGLFGAAVARAEPQVLRLALIYSMLDKSAQIKSSHLISAIAVWEYCEKSAYYIFGDTSEDSNLEELYELIVSNSEGVTKTDIRNLFNRNKSKTFVDQLLARLVKTNRIRREQRSTRGRPIEVWLPIADDKNDKSALVCPPYLENARAFQKTNNGQGLSDEAISPPPPGIH